MRRINQKILTAVFFIFTLVYSAGPTDYDERAEKINSDSVYIESVIDSLSSVFVKEEIRQFLKNISDSKKIFRPFKVDIYKPQKHKYFIEKQSEMTVSEILDFISELTEKAKILRINKLDLDNGKNFKLTDNSFKDLDKEPDYRSKEKIMEIIEQTALKSDKKSSLEWIWGKSPDNDAYYSTKLTYFDDQFSLYPEYRFYIGTDPFRDKKSWFFSLNDHPKIQPQKTFASAETINTADEEMRVETGDTANTESYKETVSEVTETEDMEIFNCGCSEPVPDFTLDIVFYEKRDDEQAAVNRTMKFSEFFNSAVGSIDTKFIRLTGTDYSFDAGEVSKTESESVIDITGDVKLCADRLRIHLSEGITEPNVKRTAELIYSKDKNGMSYYAAVITVYDGQATFFTEYKIYASSEVRKDRNSWFNRL